MRDKKNTNKLYSERIECIILSACYSDHQARPINKHIKYVMGMPEREKNGGQAEIDYVTGIDGSVVPIKVKSGTTGSLKSLHIFLPQKKIVDAVEPLLLDDEIIVIHGSRQVGKTSLMKYLMQNILKEKVVAQNIVYMDLEDFVLLDVCNTGADTTVNYLKSIGCDFASRIFLFIDEVQYLDNPSSFLKLFHDRYGSQVKLVVSGSSSFAIKSKFKDSLVGRIFSFELFGLDFEEYLWFKNVKYDLRQLLPKALEPVLKEHYKDYALYGSYPRAVLTESIEKKELILKQVSPFSKNIRTELIRMSEIFMEDTGLMNLLTHKTFSREITGALFETSIFSLLRRNTNVANIFYWRTSKGHEVDFIYEPRMGELFALEVKVRFSKQRLTAVDYFKKQYSSVRAFIVTLDKLVKPPEGIEALYPWELYGKLSWLTQK